MATPQKRGRGRPPLTEAEKKKREKRAQKAKEEAAAGRRFRSSIWLRIPSHAHAVSGKFGARPMFRRLRSR